ncbi:pseudouridine synthase [Pontibacter sp. BT310]|uniref:Pseudouridine synthase n=1 Tax=Pontibacter populi TaxID=890055 RepID=A0ABS6XD30_9BACT|nr:MULTISPECIES: pseudouridine synthase [Pontibacter]MBJ6118163.1 pseudouridine synthase [Pontibacter sp. BT310]MBR0570590.1 pseudouridine synthase [Microvirga sp. STS03]MBW3365016.1 pseudouridine synthase [Pontibacter populi]
MKALNSSLKYFIVQKLNLSNKVAINYILSGRVLVNGRKGTLSQELLPEDEVQLDDVVIKESRKNVYIAYHKPRGIESTLNTQIENNLRQALNYSETVYPVGRLDKASEGLMLLTNDGRTLFNILHAEKHQEKEYQVTVDKPLTPHALERLAEGIVIMGQKTRPAVVRQVDEITFKIILMQGLNRQIRRMCYKLGYQVEKLVRTRIITLELGNLAPGQWRFLDQDEINSLIENVSN